MSHGCPWQLLSDQLASCVPLRTAAGRCTLVLPPLDWAEKYFEISYLEPRGEKCKIYILLKLMFIGLGTLTDPLARLSCKMLPPLAKRRPISEQLRLRNMLQNASCVTKVSEAREVIVDSCQLLVCKSAASQDIEESRRVRLEVT